MNPPTGSPTPSLRQRVRMLTPLFIMALVLPLMVAANGSPKTSDPSVTEDTQDKVWVCKYVASGEVDQDGETYYELAPGVNPQHVSRNSVDETKRDRHQSLVFDQVEQPDCPAHNPEPDPDADCEPGEELVEGVCTDTGGTDGGDDTTGGDDEKEQPSSSDEEDPVVGGVNETCQGDLHIRVVDVLGEGVSGGDISIAGQQRSLHNGQLDVTGLGCGTVDVELTSVPDGFVFVRTELGTTTLAAQSSQPRGRKVSAVVSDDASSTVAFVVDPLQVLPDQIVQPAPERDPLGAPNPAPAQDDPQPAPQPAPEDPVAAPTLPRTGIPAGRLLALAILMLTAGGAMLGSRRSIDR